MECSQTITYNTFKTLEGFINIVLSNEQEKNQVLQYLDTLFLEWEMNWAFIKDYLYKNRLLNTKSTIKDITTIVPNLILWQDVILASVDYYPDYWNAFFEHIKQVQELLCLKEK